MLRSCIRRILSCLLFVFALCGCAANYINRGFRLYDDELASIMPEQHDVVDVISTLGVPSAVSAVLDVNNCFRYYYIFAHYKKVAPLPERLLDTDIVVIAFDIYGVVKSVQKTFVRDVSVSNRKTAAIGEYKFVDQISNAGFGLGAGKAETRLKKSQ